MTTTYLKLQVKSSGQYLNISGGGNSNGTIACQGNTPTTNNFLWKLIDAPGHSGWYVIQVESSGQYLNILNNATNNGATAGQGILSDLNTASSNFLWKLTNASKNPGWCFLQVKSSAQFLNIFNGGNANGTQACQGNIPTTDNFLWKILFEAATPVTHTITVSATIQQKFPPSLSDDEGHQADSAEGDKNMATLVGPGDVVTWQKGGNVSSLDNIFEPTGTDLFIVDPSQENNGKWVGIVGSLPSGAEEAYSITYTVGGEQQPTQDPKIRMH